MPSYCPPVSVQLNLVWGNSMNRDYLDRVGRNLDDLRRVVTDLNSRGISVEFLKEHLTFTGDDNDSSLSKLMFMVREAAPTDGCYPC